MKTIDLSPTTILVIDGDTASLQTHYGKGITTINNPSLEEIVETGARGLGWKCQIHRGTPVPTKITFSEKIILAVKAQRSCAADTGLDGARLVSMLARVANAKLSV